MPVRSVNERKFDTYLNEPPFIKDFIFTFVIYTMIKPQSIQCTVYNVHITTQHYLNASLADKLSVEFIPDHIKYF